MQTDQATLTEASAAPSYVIRYPQAFDTALEAGRFFHARTLAWYYMGFGAAMLAGAAIATQNRTVGLWIAFFSAGMLVMTRFAVLDRLFGRWRFRSVLDRQIQLTIDEEGIVWDGPQATSHIPWTSLTEIRANSRIVLFVRDRILLAYAPASAFATPSELDQVLAFSRRHITAAKVNGSGHLG